MYVTMIIFLTGDNNLSWLVTVVTDDNLDMRGLGCFILPTFAANLQAASFTAYVLFIWLIVRFLVTEACSFCTGVLLLLHVCPCMYLCCQMFARLQNCKLT